MPRTVVNAAQKSGGRCVGRPIGSIRSARFVKVPAAERPLVKRCLRLAFEWGDGPGTDTLVQPGTRFFEIPACGRATFPRRWWRTGDPPRGDALWVIPPRADPSRRLLFLHGGGYSGMSPMDTLYRSVASRIAHATRHCVLSIDYRLAPEHKCPSAVNDAVAALEWLSMHGPPEGDDRMSTKTVATALFVAGDSSGGGLALATALAAPPGVGQHICGVIGISPWTDLTCSGSSYQTHVWEAKSKSGDPYYTKEDSLGIASNYVSRSLSAKNPLASPMFASPLQLRSLPPTLLLVGGYEVSVDDATEMHHRMLEAGHPDASCSVYEQMWHCHTSYTEGFGLAPLPHAIRGLGEIRRWVAARSCI